MFKQGSWELSFISNQQGIWLLIMNFYVQNELTMFARLRSFLKSVALTEQFCLKNHYQGMITHIINPNLHPHLRAIGAAAYQVDDDGVWFYKYAVPNVNYDVRTHVKRIKEVT